MSQTDEIIEVKFNVDAALEVSEDGIYAPLDLEKGAFSDKKLMDPKVGLKSWELTMKFQGPNIVKAGSVIKMRAAHAQRYLTSKVQKNGFRAKSFITDPADPRLYTEYPVAELVG